VPSSSIALLFHAREPFCVCVFVLLLMCLFSLFDILFICFVFVFLKVLL
jgi:hypothetical protein